LSYEEASERLVQVYLAPIELRYMDARIQVRPATLGFRLKLDNMLAAADKQRVEEPFWSGFWKYLWNNPISSKDIPLDAVYDDQRVVAFLENEIAIRYDIPARRLCPCQVRAAFTPARPDLKWITPFPYSALMLPSLPTQTAQRIWKFVRRAPQPLPSACLRLCLRTLSMLRPSTGWWNCI
jgi:hypothetical protein